MIFRKKPKCLFCETKVDKDKAAIIEFNVSDRPEPQQRYVCDECVKFVADQSIDDESIRLFERDLDNQGRPPEGEQ